MDLYLSVFSRILQVKIHCSVLAEEAIQAAIKDYKSKQAEGAEEPKAA